MTMDISKIEAASENTDMARYDRLYHYTTPDAALKIITGDEFIGILTAKNASEAKFDSGTWWVSLSRSFTGSGFWNKNHDGIVWFLLDGAKLSSRYKIQPVDYWNHRANSETEERLFSEKQKIPLHGAIQEVWLFINPDAKADNYTNNKISAFRKIALACKTKGIKVKLIRERVNPMKINQNLLPFSLLSNKSSHVSHRSYSERSGIARYDWKDYMDLRQLVEGTEYTDLKTGYHKYLTTYTGDFLNKITALFHNSAKFPALQARLAVLLKTTRTKTAGELSAFLITKWQKIIARHDLIVNIIRYPAIAQSIENNKKRIAETDPDSVKYYDQDLIEVKREQEKRLERAKELGVTEQEIQKVKAHYDKADTGIANTDVNRQRDAMIDITYIINLVRVKIRRKEYTSAEDGSFNVKVNFRNIKNVIFKNELHTLHGEIGGIARRSGDVEISCKTIMGYSSYSMDIKTQIVSDALRRKQTIYYTLVHELQHMLDHDGKIPQDSNPKAFDHRSGEYKKAGWEMQARWQEVAFALSTEIQKLVPDVTWAATKKRIFQTDNLVKRAKELQGGLHIANNESRFVQRIAQLRPILMRDYVRLQTKKLREDARKWSDGLDEREQKFLDDMLADPEVQALKAVKTSLTAKQQFILKVARNLKPNPDRLSDGSDRTTIKVKGDYRSIRSIKWKATFKGTSGKEKQVYVIATWAYFFIEKLSTDVYVMNVPISTVDIKNVKRYLFDLRGEAVKTADGQDIDTADSNWWQVLTYNYNQQANEDTAGRDAEHNMHINILMKQLQAEVRRGAFEIEQFEKKSIGRALFGDVVVDGPAAYVELFAMDQNFRIWFISTDFVTGIESPNNKDKLRYILGLASKDGKDIYCFIQHTSKKINKEIGLSREDILNYIEGSGAQSIRHELAHTLDFIRGRKMSVRYNKDYYNNPVELEAILQEVIPFFVDFVRYAFYNEARKEVHWNVLTMNAAVIRAFNSFMSKKKDLPFGYTKVNSASRAHLDKRLDDIMPFAAMQALKHLRASVLTLPKNHPLRQDYHRNIDSPAIKAVRAKYKENYVGKLFKPRSFHSLDPQEHFSGLDWSSILDTGATQADHFAHSNKNPVTEIEPDEETTEPRQVIRQLTSDFFNRLLIVMAQNRYARAYPDLAIYSLLFVEFRSRLRAVGGDIRPFMPVISVVLDNSRDFIYEIFINNDRLSPFDYGIPDQYQVNSPFDEDGELTQSRIVQYEQGLLQALREIRLKIVEGRRQSRLFRKPKE